MSLDYLAARALVTQVAEGSIPTTDEGVFRATILPALDIVIEKGDGEQVSAARFDQAGVSPLLVDGEVPDTLHISDLAAALKHDITTRFSGGRG